MLARCATFSVRPRGRTRRGRGVPDAAPDRRGICASATEITGLAAGVSVGRRVKPRGLLWPGPRADACAIGGADEIGRPGLPRREFFFLVGVMLRPVAGRQTRLFGMGCMSCCDSVEQGAGEAVRPPGPAPAWHWKLKNRFAWHNSHKNPFGPRFWDSFIHFFCVFFLCRVGADHRLIT